MTSRSARRPMLPVAHWTTRWRRTANPSWCEPVTAILRRPDRGRLVDISVTLFENHSLAQEHVPFSLRGTMNDAVMHDGWHDRPLAEYRAALHEWLDAHADELAPRYEPPGTLDDRIAQMQRVKSILFAAGWMRLGWPERGRRAGRLADAAHRARRRAGGSRPHRPGAVLAHRGARTHGHRLRAAGAGGRDGAAPALGCRDVVPGFLGAGERAATSRRCAAGPHPTAIPQPRRPG